MWSDNKINNSQYIQHLKFRMLRISLGDTNKNNKTKELGSEKLDLSSRCCSFGEITQCNHYMDDG